MNFVCCPTGLILGVNQQQKAIAIPPVIISIIIAKMFQLSKFSPQMICTVTANERSRYFLKQAHFLAFRFTRNPEGFVLLVELGKKFEITLRDRISRPLFWHQNTLRITNVETGESHN
ncbi:hypothetical protein BV372_30140 [Nostoc sp. T09]|uniref:hypothetical protein n=1 Tax=Nostoc sp. T09 TaxID=1932621 RepID=UPI000A3A976C|nr:hypothetical protein [Nostoc sp. T09]OUL23191.1 hypothetical protein BV372_30140 [Nostoc sp. T09]